MSELYTGLLWGKGKEWEFVTNLEVRRNSRDPQPCPHSFFSRLDGTVRVYTCKRAMRARAATESVAVCIDCVLTVIVNKRKASQ